MTFIRLLATAFLLAAGTTSAQLTYPPDDLTAALHGVRRGETIRPSFLARGVWRGSVAFDQRVGLVTRVTWTGAANDITSAAKVLAIATQYDDDEDQIRESLTAAKPRLLGKGRRPFDVGRDVDVHVDWGATLKVTAEYRRFKFDDRADRHVQGRQGPIIREFSDFQCPYCQQYAQKTKPIIDHLVARGRARFSYVHLPLERHAQALPLAIGSECAADQGGFWRFHDEAMRTNALVPSLELARQLKLDLPRFKTCLSGKDARARVERDLTLSRKVNAGGTPTVFVGPYLFLFNHTVESYEHMLNFAEKMSFAESGR